ncbi:MAG: AraC family transcriptional regulator [Chitinophagaceae bacterium]
MVRTLKPALRQLTWDNNFSINVKVEPVEYLSNSCHYHPEIELVLLKRSAGTRIIGTSVENFTVNDVVLIGKNVPHAFLHDEKCLQKNNSRPPEALVIQFYETFLGKEFLELPEFKEIQHLFIMARQGLCLTDEGKKKIIPLMEKMLHASSLGRILLLLEILKIMINKKFYRILISVGYVYQVKTEDERRINKIVDFTSKNYDHNIRIDDVAGIVNLTKESFCRYFKAQTHKTYLEFLIEYRINKACRMIIENQKSIKEIGYSCGFDSLSNFHYQFKKIIKQSPLEYKYCTLNHSAVRYEV